MKYIFIINPKAGNKDMTAAIYDMADRLRDHHGLEVTCMLTDRPGGATDMARKLAESGEEVRLYACGGDGTIHEVAEGIAGYENAAMSCIPTGTGNDFLKNFGNMAAAFADAENSFDGPSFPLDLIDCNGKLCLTIACNGVDAQVAESVHEYGAMFSGRGSYIASIVMNVLIKPISHRWEVEIDGVGQEGEYLLVSMCNGRYYGGGSTPVPEARMDDGVLHTVLIKKIGKVTFAKLFGPYSDGKYRELPKDLIQVVTAKEVRIRSEQEIVSCVDGECFRSHEVVMKLSDKRVNFFGPKGCDPNATAIGI
ncbi:MAG: YegS/Rv2252/BmrU family lipid kinase [Oscillibacter sp.]|nr:YegS/Rv2252/BmrU family lipid kinase [Oscillibacter sp.]